MKEALKKRTGAAFKLTDRSITLSLQSQIVVLNGKWEWDMQSDSVYCSDVMFFPENFIGTKGIVHPDDLAHLANALTSIEDKEAIDISFRIITTYGEIKTVRGTDISFDDAAETESGFPCTEPWQDVLNHLAEKKENDFFQLRSALTEITERLHGIGSYLLAKATLQVWFSDNVFRIHKLAPQSFNAHPHLFNPFIHVEDKDAVIDAFEKGFHEELPLEIEYRISLPDGEVKFVQHITRWLIDGKGSLICCGIIRDITHERSVANEILKAQADTSLHQQLLKFSEQQSGIAYWHINLLTRKTFYSENYWRIFGMKPSNLLNLQSFLNLVHADDREAVKTLFDKMYTDYVMAETEFRVIRPDGKIRFLKQSGRFLVDPNKEPVMIGVVQDITSQRKLETKITELNENASLNKFISESAENFYDISSIIFNEDGTVQASDGFLRMTGIKPNISEDLSKRISKIIYPDDKELWNQIQDDLSNRRLPCNHTVRFILKTGVRSISISFTQLSNEKEIIVGLLQDVTAQISLQQKLTKNKSFSDLLLDSVNDIIVFTNTDHTIINWNEKAEQKTGIKKEDALNQNLFDVLPLLSDEEFMSQLKSVLNGEAVLSRQTHQGYFRNRHQYSLLPLKVDDQNIGVMHVVHDISRQFQLQNQLHERLNFIENLVDFSVDRIVVLDKEMNYLYWNQKAEDYYGIEKEKIIGKNILEIFPSFKNDAGYQEFRKVLKGETVFLPARLIDENKEYAETYLTPIKDEDGNVNAVLWIVHDLSNEFELKKRTQLAETILHASNNRITVFDRDYRFVTWNKRCEEIHGVPSEKVIGKTIFEMFPGVENNPVFMKAQERSLRGEYVHVPSVQDGYTGAYLELFYVPLKNEWGETYAVLNIMHDVTNYVKQTEALDTLNKELEIKNAELEQKNEEITHFSFVASHDMKEPLRKMYTFSDWLMNQELTNLSPKGKSLVEKINACVKRMDLLIEDILVLTKIHSDKHQEENVDLNNVLHKVMEDLSDKIRQTQTEITSEHLPQIKGNDNQLFYLFKNLISNAIKFQRPGNVPHIRINAKVVSANEIKLHENVEKYLELSFTDNGFGFDSRYAKKIFQVFQRLHGKQEFEGTGIGLAICKKIMENHRGVITVESEEGKGSRFICYFPLR